MRCEPANTIIQKFNGLKALAEAANVSVHSVMRWRTVRDKGGTGGIIPHWHVEAILNAAKERKIKLEPADFLSVPPRKRPMKEAAE